MTEKILTTFKRQVEELTLVPSDGGRFEIYVNGDQIYSKLETGEFPDEDSIIEQLQAKLPA